VQQTPKAGEQEVEPLQQKDPTSAAAILHFNIVSHNQAARRKANNAGDDGRV